MIAIFLRGGRLPAAPSPSAATKTDVRLWVGRDVAPGPKIRLSLNTRSVSVVRLTAYKLDAARWLLRRETRDAERPPVGPRPQPLPPGKPVREWTVGMADPKARSAATAEVSGSYFSRQVNLPPLPPGVYLLVASGGGREAWGVVNITNLAVVLKRAPRQVLAWVTDHQTGGPLAGARVRLWDGSGQRTVAQGSTRRDGVCVLDAAPNPAQTLVVERTDRGRPDVAGLRLGNENPDGRLVSHLQTDRPVYRPGNTVHFRAILRQTLGQEYRAVSGKSVVVEVRDGKDNVLAQTRETTTAAGTLSHSFTVPPTGVLGAYSIVLTLPDKQTAYATFTVAEYRKPDFKVVVTPLAKRYLSGQKAGFSLQADYYFGAPLPQAQIRYQIRRTHNPFDGSVGGDSRAESYWVGSGGGNLYPRDTYATEPFVAEGTVYTDRSGRAAIPFDTKRDLPDFRYFLTCTVVDGQRRQVEATSEVPVYASNRRVRLRTSVLAAPVGSVVPFEIRLADLDGRPVSGRVALSTQHSVYDAKRKRDETRRLSQQQAIVGAAGETLSLPVLAEGSVEVVATVTDPSGRIARARTEIWGVDASAKAQVEETQPTVTIRLGKKIYRPGETAQIFLSTSTASRPSLLTVEGDGLFAYIVVPRGKTNFSWQVPTSLRLSPNAFVGASQWARPSQLVSASVLLPVPDPSRRVRLSVVADKAAYRPGETATYTVEARAAATNRRLPNVEVALAVVDESLFAVRPDTTPDPFDTFWGRRENKTETLTSAPEELSGGAYQRNSTSGVAPVRERFLDTAFWSAHLTTGPDGTATATVDLPGNLTTWRATAIGATMDTRVGRTASSITVSRPVMLRLAAPRQFVQGDQLILIGTVTNRTDQDRDFEATLFTDGVALARGKTETKTVRVAAKSEGKVQWSVSALDLPTTPGRRARIEGVLVTKNLAPGEALVDYSDRLRLSVPVRPPGVAGRIVVGGTLPSSVAESVIGPLSLPADRIRGATEVTVTVEGGIGQASQTLAAETFLSDLWNSGTASDLLRVAAAPNAPKADPARLRDALALLSRDQTPTGSWGWWADAPESARQTARVLAALGEAKQNRLLLPPGIPFPESLLKRGAQGASSLYRRTNLWEERAALAAALAAADPAKAPLLEEVRERGGEALSPYAALLLAEGLNASGNRRAAQERTERVLRIAVVRPESAFVPAGDHPGWYASTATTTAQALVTLLALRQNDALQAKLARWLAYPTDGENAAFLSGEDRAEAARALLRYSRAHLVSPVPPSEQDLSVAVNGTVIPFAVRVPGTEAFTPLTAVVPIALLKDGENSVRLTRQAGRAAAGELFATATATVYRPQTGETDNGLRVLRRWEVQNPYGLWEALTPGKTIRPGVPVRVTVVAWPGEEADALRVEEPLPSGFEFVDSELGNGAREEVRDGAIIHFLRADGATPVSFRYFLRAEASGTFTVLPASGELIRRPAVQGASAPQPIVVGEVTATEGREGKP
ncbi:MAG: hypothetical protein H7Z41_01925 [Cytophagales bacterium]|nr:hypothetical protein [Armatimonadota bacterium]